MLTGFVSSHKFFRGKELFLVDANGQCMVQNKDELLLGCFLKPLAKCIGLQKPPFCWLKRN